MPAPRPVELLQEVVDLLRQLADQGRAWSAEDLLTHGEAPCPSPKGCVNRRERAGLPPAQSGTSRAERRARKEPERAAARVLELEREAERLEAALVEVRTELARLRGSEAS